MGEWLRFSKHKHTPQCQPLGECGCLARLWQLAEPAAFLPETVYLFSSEPRHKRISLPSTSSYSKQICQLTSSLRCAPDTRDLLRPAQ